MLLLYPHWPSLDDSETLSWLSTSSLCKCIVQVRSGSFGRCCCSQTVSLMGEEVLYVWEEGAAAWFSCSYCSPIWPGWQGLAGELSQHFSYCYVSVPGLGTACGGQRRVWVPLAMSVWSLSLPHHWGRWLRTNWVRHGTTKKKWRLCVIFIFYFLLCSCSEITAQPLKKKTVFEISVGTAASTAAAALQG